MVSSGTTPDSRLFDWLRPSLRQQGLGPESLRIRTFTILGSSTTETLKMLVPPNLVRRGFSDGFSRAAISEQIYKYTWTALCSSSGASSLGS